MRERERERAWKLLFGHGVSTYFDGTQPKIEGDDSCAFWLFL
jgi:hypothetical protein